MGEPGLYFTNTSYWLIVLLYKYTCDSVHSSEAYLFDKHVYRTRIEQLSFVLGP